MRARDILLLAALSAGCTVAGSSSPDPAGGADAAPPAGADAAPGEVLPVFEEPARIDALAMAGYEDDDPTVTADLLEMYFNSDRLGGLGGSDIWRSRRASPSDPWGAPRPVRTLSSEFDESAPEVSPDGLSLWLSSDRPGGQGAYDIYLSTRATRDARWSDPVPVVELNTPSGDLSPSVDASGTLVVFYSNRAGGDNDLFVATRGDPAAPWGTPEYLSILNTDRSEADPYLADDGLSLYFAAGTTQDLDIYRSTRDDPAGPFGIPQPLAEVNSEYHDADPWLAWDGGYMLMTSGRTGDNEIYEVHVVRSGP